MTRLLHFYANLTFLRCCKSVSPVWPETMHSGTALFHIADTKFHKLFTVVKKANSTIAKKSRTATKYHWTAETLFFCSYHLASQKIALTCNFDESEQQKASNFSRRIFPCGQIYTQAKDIVIQAAILWSTPVLTPSPDLKLVFPK